MCCVQCNRIARTHERVNMYTRHVFATTRWRRGGDYKPSDLATLTTGRTQRSIISVDIVCPLSQVLRTAWALLLHTKTKFYFQLSTNALQCSIVQVIQLLRQSRVSTTHCMYEIRLFLTYHIQINGMVIAELSTMRPCFRIVQVACRSHGTIFLKFCHIFILLYLFCLFGTYFFYWY